MSEYVDAITQNVWEIGRRSNWCGRRWSRRIYRRAYDSQVAERLMSYDGT